MVHKYLQAFVEELKKRKIEVYNEFSLQHELGIYLRNALPNYKVEFERYVRNNNLADYLKNKIINNQSNQHRHYKKRNRYRYLQ